MSVPMYAHMPALMCSCCRLISSRAWSKLPLGSGYATQQDNAGCSQGHQLDREELQQFPSLPKTTARLRHLSSPWNHRFHLDLTPPSSLHCSLKVVGYCCKVMEDDLGSFLYFSTASLGTASAAFPGDGADPMPVSSGTRGGAPRRVRAPPDAEELWESAGGTSPNVGICR